MAVHGFCRLLGWFLAVSLPIGLYGEATAPLLLILMADIAVGHRLLRMLAASRTALPVR